MKKIIFSVGIFAALLVTACTNQPESITIEQVGKFPVTQPYLTDTSIISEYVAEIQSVQNVEIRARIKSFVRAIHVDEGKSVKKGQLLFSFADQALQEALNKAQAMLNAAEAESNALTLEIRNIRSLVDKNVVSKTELEIAESNLEVLKAKIEEAKSDAAAARLNLTFTQIRAPFDGVVSRIPYKVGSLVEEGDLLTTISDNGAVFAYFNVSEQEYLGMTQQKDFLQKNNLTLLLADGQPHQYKGAIETIDGQFDKNTGNIAFRARFPNPKQLLRHGSSGKVQIEQKLKNVMIIPQKSTFEVQDKTYVYCVDEQNVVSLRCVVPKIRLPHLFVVESGLTTKDRVIYEGIQNVRDGEKVEIALLEGPKPQVLSQLLSE